MKRKTIIKGTLILTIASLISRILGFVNRIYLANLIGAEGMGLYQLVFPIYMICYTICCSGLFVAISRLTSTYMAKGNKQKALRVITISSSISIGLSLILALLLFTFSDYIAVNIVKEARISGALRIVSFSLPFTAICHSLKGYFYGTSKTIVPAFSIVFEQIVRITIIYFLSLNFLTKGLVYACNAAVFAMVVGELASAIYVFIRYHLTTHSLRIRNSKINNRLLSKEILSIAVPLTTNRLITTFLSSYETILIPTKLVSFGYSNNYALSIYGTLTGMAMPLIFFPTVLTSSASLMLLSSISDAHARNQNNIIQYTTSKTIKYALILGITFTFFFYEFGHQLGVIIYNEAYVGTLLVTLGFLCPFLYLVNTLSGILNGMNKHMITFRNNIIGLTIRIIFIYSFVPVLGIKGYLYGLIISVFVVAVLDIFFVVKYVKLKFDAFSFLLKPAFCGLLTITLLDIMIKNNIINFTSNAIVVFVVYIGLFFGMVLGLLLATNTITIKEFKESL